MAWYDSVMTVSAVSQDVIEPDAILLGRVPLGDGVASSAGESHLLTIAPATAGRRDSCVIPNLLTYPGPVVVVDLTGEAYAVTSRARREMGQAVVRLDPFRVIDEESDALNPLDLLQGLEGPALESACLDVAGLLPGYDSLTDVWGNAAFGLLSGVIGYLAAIPEKGKFADLYSTFHSDDTVYSLAVVLDTVGKKIPKMSYSEIAYFLQKADAERSRVLTSVTSQLKAMSGQEAQKALGTSTFSLTDLVESKPISIYVTVPPARLPSHFSLLRVWIGTLLHGILRRRARPAQPTLVLLDECAKLGPFPLLEAAIVSGRDCGLRVWTFWQDLHQLRSLYPAGWLVGNTGAFQAFGVRDLSTSAELAALLGVEPESLRGLAADEQVVWQDGGSHRIKRFDYLTDPLFAGRFDQRSPRPRTPQV